MQIVKNEGFMEEIKKIFMLQIPSLAPFFSSRFYLFKSPETNGLTPKAVGSPSPRPHPKVPFMTIS